jgi:hypothetical protein
MNTKILGLSIIIAMTACKKNNDVDGCTDVTANNYNSSATIDDGTCTFTPVVNPTCDGHPTNSDVFPLIQGTKWDYDQTGTYSNTYYEINGTSDINGVTYINRDFSQFSGNITGTKQFRIDTNNGDVYYRSGANDYMQMPGTPTLGQSWVDEYTVIHEIVDLNATVTTNACTYTGCVKVLNDYTSSADTYNYYKSGIGMIKSQDFTLVSLEF